MIYTNYFKRTFDFLAAMLGILITLPIVLIVWGLLAIANSGKPFFFQPRPGKNEKIFTLIKFKTMNDRKDKNGVLLPDAKRLTALGKFIRKTSLDELPQLINVLKGDMSLIGPRPLLVQYLPLYSDFQKRRHDVRPGITGWAQVNGRNIISWDERFKMDIWYVENISLILDLKILFLTIIKIVKSEGVNQGGENVTMEEFRG